MCDPPGMYGAAFCTKKNGPFTFTPTTRSKSSSVVLSKLFPVAPSAALAMSISILPVAPQARVSSTRREIEGRELASAWMARAWEGPMRATRASARVALVE